MLISGNPGQYLKRVYLLSSCFSSFNSSRMSKSVLSCKLLSWRSISGPISGSSVLFNHDPNFLYCHGVDWLSFCLGFITFSFESYTKKEMITENEKGALCELVRERKKLDQEHTTHLGCHFQFKKSLCNY